MLVITIDFESMLRAAIRSFFSLYVCVCVWGGVYGGVGDCGGVVLSETFGIV